MKKTGINIKCQSFIDTEVYLRHHGFHFDDGLNLQGVH